MLISEPIGPISIRSYFNKFIEIPRVIFNPKLIGIGRLTHELRFGSRNLKKKNGIN